MSEEKRQPSDVASDRTGWCGPEMEQMMKAFFASMSGKAEGAPGSCPDRMAEMMKACCGSFTGKDEPADEDESAVD